MFGREGRQEGALLCNLYLGTFGDYVIYSEKKVFPHFLLCSFPVNQK